MDVRSHRFPPLTIAGLMGLAALPLTRFLAVGAMGLTTDAVVFTLLHDAGLSRSLARALSLLVATGVTWTLNRTFTFAATGRRRRIEAMRYGLVVGVAQGISYGVFLFLSWAAPRAPALADLFAGAVIATAISFTGQRLFTFRAIPVLQP